MDSEPTERVRRLLISGVAPGSDRCGSLSERARVACAFEGAATRLQASLISPDADLGVPLPRCSGDVLPWLCRLAAHLGAWQRGHVVILAQLACFTESGRRLARLSGSRLSYGSWLNLVYRALYAERARGSGGSLEFANDHRDSIQIRELGGKLVSDLAALYVGVAGDRAKARVAAEMTLYALAKSSLTDRAPLASARRFLTQGVATSEQSALAGARAVTLFSARAVFAAAVGRVRQALGVPDTDNTGTGHTATGRTATILGASEAVPGRQADVVLYLSARTGREGDATPALEVDGGDRVLAQMSALVGALTAPMSRRVQGASFSDAYSQLPDTLEVGGDKVRFVPDLAGAGLLELLSPAPALVESLLTVKPPANAASIARIVAAKQQLLAAARGAEDSDRRAAAISAIYRSMARGAKYNSPGTCPTLHALGSALWELQSVATDAQWWADIDLAQRITAGVRNMCTPARRDQWTLRTRQTNAAVVNLYDLLAAEVRRVVDGIQVAAYSGRISLAEAGEAATVLQVESVERQGGTLLVRIGPQLPVALSELLSDRIMSDLFNDPAVPGASFPILVEVPVGPIRDALQAEPAGARVAQFGIAGLATVFPWRCSPLRTTVVHPVHVDCCSRTLFPVQALECSRRLLIRIDIDMQLRSIGGDAGGAGGPAPVHPRLWRQCVTQTMSGATAGQSGDVLAMLYRMLLAELAQAAGLAAAAELHGRGAHAPPPPPPPSRPAPERRRASARVEAQRRRTAVQSALGVNVAGEEQARRDAEARTIEGAYTLIREAEHAARDGEAYLPPGLADAIRRESSVLADGDLAPCGTASESAHGSGAGAGTAGPPPGVSTRAGAGAGAGSGAGAGAGAGSHAGTPSPSDDLRALVRSIVGNGHPAGRAIDILVEVSHPDSTIGPLPWRPLHSVIRIRLAFLEPARVGRPEGAAPGHAAAAEHEGVFRIGWPLTATAVVRAAKAYAIRLAKDGRLPGVDVATARALWAAAQDHVKSIRVAFATGDVNRFRFEDKVSYKTPGGGVAVHQRFGDTFRLVINAVIRALRGAAVPEWDLDPAREAAQSNDLAARIARCDRALFEAGLAGPFVAPSAFPVPHVAGHVGAAASERFGEVVRTATERGITLTPIPWDESHRAARARCRVVGGAVVDRLLRMMSEAELELGGQGAADGDAGGDDGAGGTDEEVDDEKAEEADALAQAGLDAPDLDDADGAGADDDGSSDYGDEDGEDDEDVGTDEDESGGAGREGVDAVTAAVARMLLPSRVLVHLVRSKALPPGAKLRGKAVRRQQLREFGTEFMHLRPGRVLPNIKQGAPVHVNLDDQRLRSLLRRLSQARDMSRLIEASGDDLATVMEAAKRSDFRVKDGVSGWTRKQIPIGREPTSLSTNGTSVSVHHKPVAPPAAQPRRQAKSAAPMAVGGTAVSLQWLWSLHPWQAACLLTQAAAAAAPAADWASWGTPQVSLPGTIVPATAPGTGQAAAGDAAAAAAVGHAAGDAASAVGQTATVVAPATANRGGVVPFTSAWWFTEGAAAAICPSTAAPDAGAVGTAGVASGCSTASAATATGLSAPAAATAAAATAAAAAGATAPFVADATATATATATAAAAVGHPVVATSESGRSEAAAASRSGRSASAAAATGPTGPRNTSVRIDFRKGKRGASGRTLQALHDQQLTKEIKEALQHAPTLRGYGSAAALGYWAGIRASQDKTVNMVLISNDPGNKVRSTPPHGQLRGTASLPHPVHTRSPPLASAAGFA